MSNNHYNKKLKLLARKLRHRMTRAEKIMWYELLSGKKLLGYKFLRQRSIDNYIVDFYFKELKLIIEIDGSSHGFGDAIEYDIKREERLRELGFDLI